VRQKNAHLASDVLEDFVDGAGDVDRGRHAEEHDGHNVWHVPRSNWMRRESTGAHFTLKLANSGMTSVGRARFKSPLAHQFETRADLGLYGIRGRS
jgi:hypothetical protein